MYTRFRVIFGSFRLYSAFWHWKASAFMTLPSPHGLPAFAGGPLQDDLPTFSTVRLVTTKPYLKELEKRCCEGVRHAHGHGTKTADGRQHLQYTKAIASTFAGALQYSWLKGFTPEPCKEWVAPSLGSLQGDKRCQATY